MIGDLPLVNFSYAPFMEVLPRKYRFRILNACMSRFFQFAIAGPDRQRRCPFQFICQRRQPGGQPDHADRASTSRASPSATTSSSTSRRFRIGDRLHLVNVLKQTSGNKPDAARDPGAGHAGRCAPIRCSAPCCSSGSSARCQSVDVPGVTLTTANSCGTNDKSVVPTQTHRSDPDRDAGAHARGRALAAYKTAISRDPVTGQCTPDCSEVVFSFPGPSASTAGLRTR